MHLLSTLDCFQDPPNGLPLIVDGCKHLLYTALGSEEDKNQYQTILPSSRLASGENRLLNGGKTDAVSGGLFPSSRAAVSMTTFLRRALGTCQGSGIWDGFL